MVRGLLAAGVSADDRVVLHALPSAAAVAALHGLARLGVVTVPLPAGLTATELAAAVDVARPRIVVAGPGFEAAAAPLGRPVVHLETLIQRGEPGPSAPAITPRDPEAPAVAILTSGTTGRPKAALLLSAALAASAESWLAALPPATGWLLALGLGHVAGLGVVWRAALAGVPLVVMPRADPAAIAATLAGEPVVSHVSLVPTTLLRLFELKTGPPPTVRAVLLGGGEIGAGAGGSGPGGGLADRPAYGLTEAGSGVTALPTADAGATLATAGRALPGVVLRNRRTGRHRRRRVPRCAAQRCRAAISTTLPRPPPPGRSAAWWSRRPRRSTTTVGAGLDRLRAPSPGAAASHLFAAQGRGALRASSALPQTSTEPNVSLASLALASTSGFV